MIGGLILAGLIALFFIRPTRGGAKTQVAGTNRETVGSAARRGMRVRKQWWPSPEATPAHQTGGFWGERGSQPKDEGTGIVRNRAQKEMDVLDRRVARASYPEWKMRFQRWRHRLAAQLERSETGKVGWEMPDRFHDYVGAPTELSQREGFASSWTRAQATYQQRFTRRPTSDCVSPEFYSGRGDALYADLNPMREPNRNTDPLMMRTFLRPSGWGKPRYPRMAVSSDASRDFNPPGV